MNHGLLDALADVRRLKRQVIESQQFYGYSGVARLLGGCCSLVTAAVLGSSVVPQTVSAHLFGWAALCAISALLNYGAVALWYSRLESDALDRKRLRPIFDPLPALAGGGLMTFACIIRGYTDLLFGVWMIFFGISHLAARSSLDQEISYLGWYYLMAGTLMLFLFPGSFLNPWPMGIVFFAGEVTGGLIFSRMRRRTEDD